MKQVEQYYEFEGSRVRIWKRINEGLPLWKKLIYRYHWELFSSVGEFIKEGNSMTHRQARNDVLALILDKEWEYLPLRRRERNVRNR